MNASISNLPETPASDASSPPRSVWPGRIWLIFKVITLIEMGMVLVVMPWTNVWMENSLISGHIRLHDIVTHGFVRGAVTGLGLINVWFGIWEAVHYHES